MGVESAVIASDFVECNKVLAYHYDTFGYIEIDHTKAKEAFKSKGKELVMLEIGNSMEL
jgi:L-ascorbate metabolism protein UlaG (beta-lactamase superfamily)